MFLKKYFTLFNKFFNIKDDCREGILIQMDYLRCIRVSHGPFAEEEENVTTIREIFLFGMAFFFQSTRLGSL